MNKIEEFLKDVREANIINRVMFEKLNEIAGRYQTSNDQQLTLTDVGCSKITALVTYWKWHESGHAMLDDTKNKTTKIVEVEKLVDINKMFTNLIDVKILK